MRGNTVVTPWLLSFKKITCNFSFVANLQVARNEFVICQEGIDNI